MATNLMVLRLSGSEIEDRGGYVVARTPDNPGYWWGNFITLPRPPRASEVPHWLAVFARELPHARHITFGVDHAPRDPDGTGWTRSWVEAGLTYELSTALVATAVHEPPRPNREATCRPLAGDDEWDEVVELHCANNDRLEPQSYRAFAAQSVRERRAMVDAGHGQWFGAFLGGRLSSSMGLFTDGSGVARFQAVDTHPSTRRLGLAGTLVHHVASWGLSELGARQLVMVADPAAEAISVYRSVGFVDAEPVHQFEQPAPGDVATP